MSPTLVGRSVATLLLIVLVPLSPVDAVAPASASGHAVAERGGGPRVIGHRGFPGTAVTENTLASFRRAVRAGARGVELDVRVTHDGRFVVMHDDALERTTTCDGTVSGSTLVRVVRHCRGDVRGERIPSLGTTAGWFRRHRGITPVIELKEGGWTPALFRRVRRVVTERRILGRAVFISGNVDLLRRAERAAPQLRTHALADSWTEVQDLVRTFRSLDGVNLYAADATSRRVRFLHGISWRVFSRHTNSAADWTRLRQAGVDAVITDRVPELSGRR